MFSGRECVACGVKTPASSAGLIRSNPRIFVGEKCARKEVKLRDVLFLSHAKPKDAAQAAVWKKLVENTLGPPDTWEVVLSAGKDKRGNFKRLIVITDEQSHDRILAAWTPRAYVVNVAPYKNGVSYGNGWPDIDGWPERIVDYIAAMEAEAAT